MDMSETDWWLMRLQLQCVAIGRYTELSEGGAQMSELV